MKTRKVGQGLSRYQTILQMDPVLSLCMMFKSLLQAVMPYMELFFCAYLVDHIRMGRYDRIPRVMVLFILVSTGCFLLADGLGIKIRWRSMHLGETFMKKIYLKLTTVESAHLEDPSITKEFYRAKYVMEHTGGYMAFFDYLTEMLVAGIQLIAGAVLMVELVLARGQAGMGLVSLLNTPFYAGLWLLAGLLVNTVFATKISRKLNAEHQKLFHHKIDVERQFNYFTDQVFFSESFAKDIRIFAMAELITQKYRDHLDRAIAFFTDFYYQKERRILLVQESANLLFHLLVYLLVVVKGLGHAISLGSVLKYAGSIFLVNEAIASVVRLRHRLQMQFEFVDFYERFLDLPDDHGPANPMTPDFTSPLVLEFHDVSFTYPHEKTPALQHVTCQFRAGETTGLVGENGAGKTTMVKLICRWDAPTEGKITLNGVDIQTMDMDEYRRLIGVAFQDFTIFPASIAENISMSRHLDKARVLRSIEAAQMCSWIQSLPQREQTMLTHTMQEGRSASKGESQKVAMARCDYKGAPMGLYDEPTAALDPLAEQQLFDFITSANRDKLNILISHRMSSCKHCDRLYVMKDGAIVERGDHASLIQNREGLYHHLFTTQANMYGASEEAVRLG